MNEPVTDASQTTAPEDCLVAFGSNVGDSHSIYQQVGQRIGEIATDSKVAASHPVLTKAIGGPEQDDYLNGAFRFSTELGPREVHRFLLTVENEFGRVRRQRWGARQIDLDLLLYGEQSLIGESLTIPHPRMSFRRFVLEPSNEIAADMKHPVSGLTVGALFARIDLEKNDLVWITSQFELATRLVKELEEIFPGWGFYLVDQQEFSHFDFESEPPKLFVIDCAGPDPTWNAASLKLVDCSPEEMKIEVMAAIEAMAPRQCR